MKKSMKNILLGSLALLAMSPINQSLDNNLISVENNVVKEKSTVSPLDLTIEDLKYYSEYSTGTSDLYQGLWQNYEESPIVLAGESYLFNIQDFYDGGYGGITGDSTLLFSVDNTTFNLENDSLISVDKHSYLVTSVAVSKTDVIFDFQFIDFTFKNEKDETFILPVASHPFTISGTPEIPDSEADSLPAWAITLIVIACLVLVLGVLGIFFPVIFSAVKVVFKVLVKVLEVIFTIIYFVFVWWWLAIIQKIRGEEIPRIWLFD